MNDDQTIRINAEGTLSIDSAKFIVKALISTDKRIKIRRLILIFLSLIVLIAGLINILIMLPGFLGYLNNQLYPFSFRDLVFGPVFVIWAIFFLYRYSVTGMAKRMIKTMAKAPLRTIEFTADEMIISVDQQQVSVAYGIISTVVENREGTKTFLYYKGYLKGFVFLNRDMNSEKYDDILKLILEKSGCEIKKLG